MVKSKHGTSGRGKRKVKPAARTSKAATVKKKTARPAKKAAVTRPVRKPAGKAVKKAAHPAAARRTVKSAAKPKPRASAASARQSAPRETAHKPKAVVQASVGAPKPAPATAPARPAVAPSRAVKPAAAAAARRDGGGVAARLGVAVSEEQGITREDGRYALPATVNIELPKGYRPSPDEEYMNPRQLAYFRQKLKDWRDQLVEESRQTMENLREEVRDVGDDAERATRETENSLELRTRDRYRKLISKIEKALRRIEEGRYGYCEETDEEIGLERLEARPIATLSLDAQERREHLQKQMGD